MKPPRHERLRERDDNVIADAASIDWTGDLVIPEAIASGAETVLTLQLERFLFGLRLPFADDIYIVAVSMEIPFIDVFRARRLVGVLINEEIGVDVGLPRQGSLKTETREIAIRKAKNDAAKE